MFQPPKKETRLSFFTLALIGVPLGMALFGLWYFNVEPVRTWINPVVEGARGIGQAFIPTLQNAYATFLQNPIPYIAATVTTVSGLYAIASKLRSVQAENAKQQAEAQATQQAITAQNQISQQTQTLTQAQNEVATLKQQLSNAQSTDSQSLLTEAQTLLSQKTEQIKNQQAQIQALQDMLMLKDTKVIEKTVVK